MAVTTEVAQASTGTSGPAVTDPIAGTARAAAPGAATPGAVAPRPTDEPLRVWVDQDLCTGDGLCVQYAPEVFEFDIDGLAYVKGADGELVGAPGGRVDVPAHLRLDVLDSAKECPGECIHVERRADGVPVAGPGA